MPPLAVDELFDLPLLLPLLDFDDARPWDCCWIPMILLGVIGLLEGGGI